MYNLSIGNLRQPEHKIVEEGIDRAQDLRTRNFTHFESA